MSKKRVSKAGGEKVQDRSPMVHQDDKLSIKIEVNRRNDLTQKQKNILEVINDKNVKVVFIDGVAGTSKTYLGVLAGLELLNSRKMSHLIYVRSVIESASKSLGALPGEIEDKFQPFIMPLLDKLEEILNQSDIKLLLKEERIQPRPINYLRGASINAKYVLVDEAQNFTFKELVTVLTRIGMFSKFVIVGDTFQSDLNGHSGFKQMFEIFNNEESIKEGIVCVKMEKEDIVRSGILRYIMEKLEEYQRNNI